MKNATRILEPRRSAVSAAIPPFAARMLAALGVVACLTASPALACSGGLHIEVADAGVYALDHAAIVAQQPALGDCRSDDLVLLNRGAEVPIRIVGAQAGTFGSGARIEWVGQRLRGPESWFDAYSNVNVYQLTAAPGPHARMRDVAAVKATAPVALQRSVHVEQENLMLRLSDREMKPGEEPDIWQWAKLTPIDPEPFTWNFDLDDLAPAHGGANAQLTISFRGVSSILRLKVQAAARDHVVEVAVNGKPLGPQSWDGRAEVQRTIEIPAALLKAKDNRLELRVPQRDMPGGDFIVDVVMFNWFAMTYPVRGTVGDDAPSFTAAADGTIEISHDGPQAPALYDRDGGYRQSVAAGNGRFRSTARAGAEIFAVVPDKLRAPTLVRAIVPGGLRASDPGFDYLIVAHSRLIDAIQPLAEFHRTRGLRVAVADVDAVYDEFNGGIAHPGAIRNLVEWGNEHWQVKPRYLLLVGDASADIHHDARSERLNSGAYAMRPHPSREENMLPGALSNMPTTPYTQWDPDLPNRNLIPTWQFASPEGQAASDNAFVTLKPNDFHPTLAVGRLPVIQPAEVKAIVDKTIAYMTRPASGDWRREITFISTDEVRSFKAESDRLAASLGAQGYGIKSLYTKQDASEAAFAHAQLKEDLDSGNLLVHFLGHGGAFIWRVGPPADLFTLDDVSNLTNAGRYPMVLAMTCFSAPFDNPTEDSIGERFLRESERGAVAVFAASWTNSPNPRNSQKLIEELLKPDNPIGDAIVAAKAGVPDPTFVQMYNLLGDPALILARPRGVLQLARGGDRWNDQVLVRVPESNFGGEVDVDWVDAEGVTLQSQRFEVRDQQFMLPVPVAKAAEVRIYAGNLRTGFNAVGALRLIEPPPPLEAKSQRPAPHVIPPVEPRRKAPSAPATGRSPSAPEAMDGREGPPGRSPSAPEAMDGREGPPGSSSPSASGTDGRERPPGATDNQARPPPGPTPKDRISGAGFDRPTPGVMPAAKPAAKP